MIDPQIINSLQSIGTAVSGLSSNIEGGNSLGVWTAVSSVVAAFSGIAAAIASYLSARAAKMAARESELARKSDFLPIISIDQVQGVSIDRIDIVIKNIGRDLARNVVVYIPTMSDVVTSRMITLGNMAKDAIEIVQIDSLNSESLLNAPKAQRRLKILYLDLFGRLIITQCLFVREIDDRSYPRYHNPSLSNWELVLPEDNK